jgi:small-conductance mechanosensitive channel
MENIEKILEFEIISIGQYNLKIISLLAILLIIVVTKIVLWLIKRSIFRRKKLTKFNEGNSYASFQLIKYVIWVIAAGLILETFGVKVTILIAGSAALLVGIGLGLQQTFNDIISGIILLSERSIKIEDILEIDGDVVKIQEIGLRTSKGLNTDDISIIIPNSLITTNKVINWSHQTKKTRFRINKVKSDIRRIITKKFIENKVTIPFPQMDVYIKSNPKGS